MIKIKGSVLKARLDERDFTDQEKGTIRHIKNVIVTLLDDDGDPAEIKFYEPVPDGWEKTYMSEHYLPVMKGGRFRDRHGSLWT